MEVGDSAQQHAASKTEGRVVRRDGWRCQSGVNDLALILLRNPIAMAIGADR